MPAFGFYLRLKFSYHRIHWKFRYGLFFSISLVCLADARWYATLHAQVSIHVVGTKDVA